MPIPSQSTLAQHNLFCEGFDFKKIFSKIGVSISKSVFKRHKNCQNLFQGLYTLFCFWLNYSKDIRSVYTTFGAHHFHILEQHKLSSKKISTAQTHTQKHTHQTWQQHTKNTHTLLKPVPKPVLPTPSPIRRVIDPTLGNIYTAVH